MPSLQVDDLVLSYERAGSGDFPPVVLLHGGLIDSRVWDAQFAWFAERAMVVRLDLPGNGRSGAPDGPYSGFQILAAFLSALDIEEANLVGLSGGARIAIDFTISYPERTEKLVAVAPGLSGYGRWSLPKELVRRFRAALEAGDRDAAAATWLDIWAPVTKNELLGLGRDNAESLFVQARLEEIEPPAIGRLGELRAPTLLIIGDRDVQDIHTIVDLIADDAPLAHKTVFHGADHFPNVYDPAAFNAAVASFLGIPAQAGRP